MANRNREGSDPQPVDTPKTEAQEAQSQPGDADSQENKAAEQGKDEQPKVETEDASIKATTYKADSEANKPTWDKATQGEPPAGRDGLYDVIDSHAATAEQDDKNQSEYGYGNAPEAKQQDNA